MSIIIVIILKYYYTFKVLLKTGCFFGINCGGALKTQPLENRAALTAACLKQSSWKHITITFTQQKKSKKQNRSPSKEKLKNWDLNCSVISVCSLNRSLFYPCGILVFSFNIRLGWKTYSALSQQIHVWCRATQFTLCSFCIGPMRYRHPVSQCWWVWKPWL